MYPPNLVPSQRDTPPPLDLPSNVSQSLRTPQIQVYAYDRRREDANQTEDMDFLAEAHEYFHRHNEAEMDMRSKWTEEIEFVDGLKHWAGDMVEERKGRPCLTFDKIGPSVDAVVNQMRQNPPEARCNPKGVGATKEEAEIIQGILRSIDEDSQARTAYMTAFEHAVKIGRGWWRNGFDWEDGTTFLQKLVTRRITNPFSVYPDPASDEFDYSDMRRCFVTEDLDRHYFDELYAEELADGYEFAGLGDQHKAEWNPDGAKRVAEYWRVESEYTKIALLDSGMVVPVAKWDPQLGRVMGTRRMEKRKVHGAKITGHHILERWDWQGKWIPLIAVIGREILDRNGRRKLRGMIRPAMDANLEYDYLRSKEAEAIGLLPISQWVLADGQIEGFENEWNESNRCTRPYLRYHPMDSNGTPVPPPQRIQAEPAIVGLSQAIARVETDIKASLSIWEPSLGAPGPEESGRAIRMRQNQADNAHFHYADNLARAMKFDALQKLDLMRKIYSEAQALNIYDPDGSAQEVKINAPFIHKGVERFYRIGEDFSPARYDVTIGTGPSSANRREAMGQQLMQLAQSMPQPMARAIDLLVQYLDAPRELVERLRPPDVQQEAEGEAPIPPRAQQRMAKDEQMIKLLTEQLNALQQQIDSKQPELQVRKEIAQIQAMTQLAIADLKAGTDHAIAGMQEQFSAIMAELAATRQQAQQQAEMAQRQQEFQAQQEAQQQQLQQQQQQQQQAEPQPPPGA